MKFKLPIKKIKDSYRPMFLFTPHQCEKCRICIWLEYAKPFSTLRCGAMCECGEGMWTPDWFFVCLLIAPLVFVVAAAMGSILLF